MDIDLLVALNFIFSIIILIIGYWAFRKIQDPLPLYIGISFGLFGISHLAILMGYKSQELSLIVIRTLAYLLIIFALYKTATRYSKSK
jgi:hypothetical protein